jgi:hypothetical protein
MALSLSSCSGGTGFDLGARRQGRGDQPADPRLLLLREADPKVEAQRSGHFAGQVTAGGKTGHPADHLADQPAVGHGVVAVAGSRLPHGSLGGQRIDGRGPGQGVIAGQSFGKGGQAGLVRQQLPDRHRLLPGRLELGPVGGHRGVEIQLFALGQHGRHHRGHPFGRRVHERQRAGVPLPAGLLIGDAAPQVDDLAAADVHRAGGADISALAEVGLEGVPHGLESALYISPDVHRTSRLGFTR